MTATFPLQSCRMFAPRLRARSPRRRDQPVHRDGSRLWTAVEADAASSAIVPGIARRMHAVMAQLRSQLQALGRARFHAQPASFALIHVDRDIAARLARHFLHLGIAVFDACGACSHFVFSQYAYSSARNLGWAISISALARSRIDLPCRYATPYSVTM